MSGTCVNINIFHAFPRAPTFLAPDSAQQLSLSEGVETWRKRCGGPKVWKRKRWRMGVIISNGRVSIQLVPDLQLSKDSRETKLRRSEIISQSAKLDNLNM